MSELVLLRHAKSDWGSGHDTDDARPLSRRGREAACTMGRVLALAGWVPDLVLTSPALRARATAEAAAEAAGWQAAVVEDARLLPGSPGQVAAVVGERAGRAGRVLVVGHEPAWSETAAELLGGAALRMVTAAAVCIEVPSWGRLRPGEGTLLWMLTPRLFTEGRFGLG